MDACRYLLQQWLAVTSVPGPLQMRLCVAPQHPFLPLCAEDNRGPPGSMCAQFGILVGANGKPAKDGGRCKQGASAISRLVDTAHTFQPPCSRLNVRLPNCRTAVEAAITWDLAQIWRVIAVSQSQASACMRRFPSARA